jgi:hypothetical protein
VRRATALTSGVDREGFLVTAASAAPTAGVQAAGVWAVTGP